MAGSLSPFWVPASGTLLGHTRVRPTRCVNTPHESWRRAGRPDHCEHFLEQGVQWSRHPHLAHPHATPSFNVPACTGRSCDDSRCSKASLARLSCGRCHGSSSGGNCKETSEPLGPIRLLVLRGAVGPHATEELLMPINLWNPNPFHVIFKPKERGNAWLVTRDVHIAYTLPSEGDVSPSRSREGALGSAEHLEVHGHLRSHIGVWPEVVSLRVDLAKLRQASSAKSGASWAVQRKCGTNQGRLLYQLWAASTIRGALQKAWPSTHISWASVRRTCFGPSCCLASLRWRRPRNTESQSRASGTKMRSPLSIGCRPCPFELLALRSFTLVAGWAGLSSTPSCRASGLRPRRGVSD